MKENIRQLLLILFLAIYLVMVLMSTQLEKYWELAAALTFGSVALTCQLFELDYQRSYKAGEMTILNLAYQGSLMARMVFVVRTMVFKIVKFLFHECVISMTENFYTMYYFLGRPIFFLNVETVFITSLVRILLLISPRIFFAIDPETFSFGMNLFVFCGILFDLCIRIHLKFILGCKNEALDDRFLKVEIDVDEAASKCYDHCNTMETHSFVNKITDENAFFKEGLFEINIDDLNQTISYSANVNFSVTEQMTMDQERCYVIPTITTMLFLTTIFELLKILVEFYQLFMKYKYKIEQVRAARRIEVFNQPTEGMNADNQAELAVFTVSSSVPVRTPVDPFCVSRPASVDGNAPFVLTINGWHLDNLDSDNSFASQEGNCDTVSFSEHQNLRIKPLTFNDIIYELIRSIMYRKCIYYVSIVLHFILMIKSVPEKDENEKITDLISLIFILNSFYNPVYWLLSDDKALDETFKAIRNFFSTLTSN